MYKCNKCGESSKKSKYGKQCRQCADTQHSKRMLGKNNPNWTGGLPICKKCNVELSDKDYTYCQKHRTSKGKSHPRWNGGKPSCKDCGKEISYVSKRCRSCSRKKERNPKWKGGITDILLQIRWSPEKRGLMAKSKKRDNYQCLMPGCGTDKYSGNLESNHIKTLSSIVEKNKIKTLEQAYECKELWDINNLITLCKPCHRHIQKREEQFEKLFNLIIQKLYASN